MSHKRTGSSDDFVEFVREQLRELPALVCRPMFGGHGLYAGHVFFGILYRGELFFRTSDATRPLYERRGGKPFRPNAKQTLTSYHSVPADVIEDRSRLMEWAKAAIRAR